MLDRERKHKLDINDDEIIKCYPTSAYQRLAVEVLKCAVKDIATGGDLKQKTEADIMNGGADWAMAIVGMKLSRKEFIDLAEKAADNLNQD